MTCLWRDCPEAQQKFGSRRGINLLGVGRVCKCNLCGVTLFKSRLRVVTREPEATNFPGATRIAIWSASKSASSRNR